jgi:hypothetical protein
MGARDAWQQLRHAGVGWIALAALATSPAAATSRDFAVHWSSSGTASARGVLTFDDSVVANPGINDTAVTPWVTSFSVTVTGASAGNGTFTLADFSSVLLDTNGAALDLDRPLIGQIGGALFDPAFAGGAGGDFNVFNSNPAAPAGVFYGAIATNGGAGDSLWISAITPVRPLPVSTDAARCQKAVGAAGGKYLGARHRALTGCYASLLAGKPLYEDGAHTRPVSQGADCSVELKAGARIARARLALRAAVARRCSDTILASLFACAPTLDGLVGPSGTEGCLVRTLDQRLDRVLDQEFGL